MVGADGEIRYAEHRGAQLAFRTWGDGPPLIYVASQFIPVAAMDGEPAHERFLHALSSFATLIVFDRRGVGLSDPMDETPTIDDWSGQVETVITGAGFDDAYVLGHGAGGMPASTLAATRPHRVRGLILAMAYGRAVMPAGAGIEQLLASARPNEEAPPVDFLAELAPSRVGDARFRQWWSSAGRRGASPAVAQTLLALNASGDVTALVPSIEVRTLVIRRPDFRGPIFGAFFGDDIPGATVVDVPGIDVLPWLPDSDAVVAEIEDFITGQRGHTPVQRSLLTIMFTDVVGSTASAVRLGDGRWRDLLEGHDRLMREELARHDGHEIDTAGDGFLTTFATPSQAVRCATRLHRVMADIGLQLRVGIHCGEVEVRARNIAGISVHIAARTQAKANPDETLVTSTAREAMTGADVAFVDRGRHTLKGVAGRWALYAIAPPDDRSSRAER